MILSRFSDRCKINYLSLHRLVVVELLCLSVLVPMPARVPVPLFLSGALYDCSLTNAVAVSKAKLNAFDVCIGLMDGNYSSDEDADAHAQFAFPVGDQAHPCLLLCNDKIVTSFPE